MTDLARQAAEHLTRIVWGDFPDPEEGVADVIRSHGTIVSHEQAALLREVERIANNCGEFSLRSLKGGGFRARAIFYGGDLGAEWQSATANTPADALKSALDAAGVPDEKGT